MDLSAWLEQKAGISGRALDAATKACETNFIDTLEDLRIAAKNESEYANLFPQVGLRTRISAALDGSSSADQISRSSEKELGDSKGPEKADKAIKNFNDAPMRQPAKIGAARGLPTGKR